MSEAIRLERQLCAGPDGVRYVGVDPNDGARVIVERLFLARRAEHRWARLDHRIRVAGQLRDPGVAPFRGYQREGDDPYLVLGAPHRTLTDVLVEGLDRERAIAYIARLADTLDAAHRLGLVHGGLCPTRVPLAADDEIALELFGTRTGDPQPLDAIDHPCLDRDHQGPETDVYALAALSVALLTGQAHDESAEELPRSIRDSSSRLDALLTEMLLADPLARPSMAEVAARMLRTESTEVLAGSASVTGAIPTRGPSDGGDAEHFGRYRLESLIGEGGMGKVYRARDVGNDELVALKVIHEHCARDGAALQRFYREARLLAELDTPHIARFIEVNEDRGRHFLAMELVLGDSLESRLKESGALPEDEALAITRDVATALADVHDIGAVHRDVKPANVLLVPRDDGGYLAKLCDFGIARAIEPGDEELTQVGVAVGTPHYMSPEQCTGAPVGPATDVYALGISLFKMLAGEVPFNATDTRAIVYKHISEPVPDLADLRPDLSTATIRLVERMLAKEVSKRIGDARALLDALDEVGEGGSADIRAHPRLPDDGEQVKRYRFSWELRASPEALWPHVSNTERLNRAIGLGAPRYQRRTEGGDVATYGHLQVSGMDLEWREHAYEWVAPHRMGILREFSSGPFVWMRSSVELRPRHEGTELHHVIDVLPRGMIGRAATAMEVGYKARRNLERVYRRIDDHCTSTRESPHDPFEEHRPLAPHAATRLERGSERLVDLGVEPSVVEALGQHLTAAPEQEIARIRPRAFARRLDLDDHETLDGCLLATEQGLLEMLWDVICPRCQIPANIAESLAALQDHDRCEACDLSFELDFGRSVEVMFRAHPAIRKAELGTYCIGGPGHSPHVLAQVRLAPGERFEAELELEQGHYRVAARHLQGTWGFSVEPEAPLRQWEIDLGRGIEPHQNRVLGTGGQRIVLNNALDRELVARVEKSRGREHAFTAAEVACRPLFRELFSGEVLAPGQLIGVGRVTLLLVELADAWSSPGCRETEVFGRLNALKERAAAVAEQEAGTVVKLHGDGVLLSFDEPAAAIRTGFKLLMGEPGAHLCAATHCGPAMATTINDRLDYFGRVVRELDTLCRATDPGQFAIAEAVQEDPGALALLTTHLTSAPVVNAHGVVGLMVRPAAE